MASRQATAVLGHIRKLVAVHSLKQLSDRELLRRFVARRDETAFAAILKRHGPMSNAAEDTWANPEGQFQPGLPVPGRRGPRGQADARARPAAGQPARLL